MAKIAFLGCGNIATAIAGGAVSSGCVKGSDIIVFDIDSQKAKPFVDMGATPLSTVNELVRFADILFLTVKPQILPSVLEQIKANFSEKTLIVSPVAGVRIEKISQMLEKECRIIRVMPNTPLMYSAGATALSRGTGVTDEEFEFIERLFSACGVTAKVDEDLMDTVTGISGSSPAFFMRFLREIINTGVARGMSYDEAKRLVVGTMSGTAKMVMQSEKGIDELIKAVASPNGTTEAGLKTMNELEFDNTVKKVIDAAIDRSIELSK